jgi:hypothetical protein
MARSGAARRLMLLVVLRMTLLVRRKSSAEARGTSARKQGLIRCRMLGLKPEHALSAATACSG